MTGSSHSALCQHWLKWIWKSPGLEVKGFSVTAVLGGLRLKLSLRHRLHLWQSKFHFPSVHFPHSQSSPPYCQMHFTLITSILKHSQFWVQFCSLVRNMLLYLSCFGYTHCLPHFLYCRVSHLKSSLLLPLWKMACIRSLSFLFLLCLPGGPSRWLSPPSALLQCLFKQFHSHCTLL